MDTEIGGPFIDYLGVEFKEATGSRVVATWQAGEPLHQPYGIVHGGAHCGVVETLASVGAAKWLGDEVRWSASTTTPTSTARCARGCSRRWGRPCTRVARSRWVVETRDEQDRLVARGQVRLQNLR